jgi:acyl-CoA synthetase (AMP-forming)/AMP-acid ligase II
MPFSEPTTVWGLVAGAAQSHPERVLFRDSRGRSLTAAELGNAAERVAAGLGVQPGDVVSWQLPSVLESVVLLAALARIGTVQNPIIPILREQEVRHITATTGTRLLIVPELWRGFPHGDMAHRLGEALGFGVLALALEGATGSELCLPSGDPSNLPPAPTTDEACRWVYFTSGSTAAPKGVRHTDASLIASSFGMTDGLGIRAGDVYPIAWPITHIGGISMTSAVLRAGGELVLFDTFDPATTADSMAAVRPTILGTGVPFFRAYLSAQRRHGREPLYPALRAFAAGGAPTPPEILKELRETFGTHIVINSWGLTEFPIASCPSPSDPIEKLELTVGRPSPDVEVRVVDGELRLKGPQCFVGYVDASLDAEAFDDEGWLRTGDLGEVDSEGYVIVTGRLKDVIIRNGENISVLELEDVLLRHPDIVDVTVLGLPDARTGERVCAVVVPAPGREVDLGTVASHCSAEGVARHKTPEQLEIVDQIKRNPMGKVVKADLRGEILSRGGDDGRQAL